MSKPPAPTLTAVHAARDSLAHALAATKFVAHAAAASGVREPRKRRRSSSRSPPPRDDYARVYAASSAAAADDAPRPIAASAAVELQLRRTISRLEAQQMKQRGELLLLRDEHAKAVSTLQARLRILELRIPPLPPFNLGRSPAALKRHRKRNRQAIILQNQNQQAASAAPAASAVAASHRN